MISSVNPFSNIWQTITSDAEHAWDDFKKIAPAMEIAGAAMVVAGAAIDILGGSAEVVTAGLATPVVIPAEIGGTSLVTAEATLFATGLGTSLMSKNQGPLPDGWDGEEESQFQEWLRREGPGEMPWEEWLTEHGINIFLPDEHTPPGEAPSKN